MRDQYAEYADKNIVKSENLNKSIIALYKCAYKKTIKAAEMDS